MNTIKRILNFSLLPREVAVVKRIVAATLLPIMVFYMTSLNFLVAGMMTAKADETAATTLVTAEPAPAASEAPKDAPKVEAPKVETPAAPTLAPENPKAETPAVVTPPVIVETSVAPIVAPIPETPKVETSASNVPIEPTSDNFNITSSVLPTTPTVDALGESSTEKLAWVTDGKKSTTNIPVALNTTYVAPQNDQVTVTFTKLPENAGKLSIEEITLSDEQVASLHALSNKAYDITSDMADGTFVYTMTLPKPKDQKNVQIKYAEDTAGLANAETVASGDVTTKTNSVSAELDHFTTFVVTVTSGASIDVTKIERGAINPTMSVTLADDTFVGTISSPNTGSWTISSGTTTLHDPVVTITSATTATVAFTGTTALGSISIKANSAAVKAGGDINAVIVDVADTIAPVLQTVVHNTTDKTITLTWNEAVHYTTENDSLTYNVDTPVTPSMLNIFEATANGSDWDYSLSTIAPHATIDTTTFNAEKTILTVHYTGTLVEQIDKHYVVDSWTSVGGWDVRDLAGNPDNLQTIQNGTPVYPIAFAVTADTIAPTESSVILNQTAKTVTTIFSEPVQLKNGSTVTAYGDVTKNDLGIYKLAGAMTWENAAVGGVEVSAVHFSDATHLTVTYTGTLPAGIYIVDTFGADVTDLAGNKLTDAGALTFEVTDATLPTESSVVLDQTAKTVTTTFSEVVHLVNDADGTAHDTLATGDFGIYAITGGSEWHNNKVDSISAVTLNDKVLTVTYTGTLPIGTYIIDTYGTKVVDASGNEMVDAGAKTFEVTDLLNATDAVVLAEATPSESNLTVARNLVNALLDSAEKTALLVRIEVATFHGVSTALASDGSDIANNLNEITTGNIKAFDGTDHSGLYFEKSVIIEGVKTKVGKITFNDPLDMSDSATTDFLKALGTKMDMSQGTISLDFRGTTNSVALKGKSATIEFYGLDRLGFDGSTTSEEVNAKLIAMNDDGTVIDKSSLVTSAGTYTPPVGTCEVGGACYIFSVPVAHFTKYKIDDAAKTTPNVSGEATLSGETTQVVLDDPNQNVTVEVASGTQDPTIDVSGIIGVDGTGVLPEIVINSDVADVVIPDGTTVTGPAGWDGIISAPTSGTPSGGNAPAGFAVGDTVITLGSPDGTITFDTPVVITLPGVTGSVGYRPSGSTQWHEITNVCTGTYESPTGAPAGGECAISNGTDTKILTYHFTSFGSLLDTLAPDGVKNLGAKYRPDTKDVKLSWDAKDKTIEKVYVYRGTNKNFIKDNGSRVSKQKRQEDTFTDSDVEIGKTYFYKIVTEDTAGNQSDAKVIKITIPTNGKAAVGVLQGTESASKDNATSGNDNGNAINTANASNDSGNGAVLGETVGNNNNANQNGFWGSNWKWILVVIVAGAGILVWRKRKQGKLA